MKQSANSEKALLSMSQNIRLLIPVEEEEYEQMKKTIYRTPKYWFDAVSKTTWWMFSVIIKTQLAAFFGCLLMALNAGLVWDGNGFGYVFHASVPLAWVLCLVFVLVHTTLGKPVIHDLVFKDYLRDLVEKTYADTLSPVVEVSVTGQKN